MEKFAFILHPLVVEDFAKKFPLLKYVSGSILEKISQHISPFKASHITGIKSPYSEAEGWFIALPLTAKQMVELPEEVVTQKIIEAGQVAERLGAKIVGLGAFTSIVGDAGVTVAKHLNIAVTTGNSYTVATALQGVEKSLQLLGKNITDVQVTIVGATGSIGAACTRILARKARRTVLVARHTEKLQALADELKPVAQDIAISIDIKASLQDADVVLTVTSAVDCIINPKDLKSGAVVCDVARPRNVSRSVSALRKDVLVIEGGVIQLPGQVDFGMNFGFPPGLSYACMAETILLALDGRYENFTLGRNLSVGQIKEIEALAEKHQFKLAGFRNFEKAITAEQIASVKKAIKVV